MKKVFSVLVALVIALSMPGTQGRQGCPYIDCQDGQHQ